MKHFNLYIRRALPSDIDSIYAIEIQAFGKYHWSKQSFIKELSNNYSRYFVACITESMEKIVGYSGYWKVYDEGHIMTVAVAELFRRMNVADILLYSIIRNALTDNIKWLTLEVRASNIPAINLYKKFKFNQLGIRKKYYQDNNEDGIIYWSGDLTNNDYIRYLESNVVDKFIDKFVLIN